MEDAKWYVVHTYSGYENKVAANIEKVVENRNMQDEILEVKVPTELVTEIREDGKTKEVERKIFPGYVLVKMGVSYDTKSGEMKMTDEAWYVVRNTRGVTGFVGPESKPRPLSENEVIAMGVEKRTIEVSYAVGDLVSVIGGPFDSFQGTVEFIDVDNDLVRVMISMMGRETPIELGLDQVEPVLD
ncbi:MAG: transcription termination/antitermination protein NusG [Clostridiales bacterium]|nr:transcription termination/antitermination protein NusG [Clostridiales bacterium]MCD7827489.1 transcription termination/antitermination protein NusG [Clostridiales bacterium]